MKNLFAFNMKRAMLCFILFSAASITMHAQTNDTLSHNNNVFTQVEQMPNFYGSISEYISNHLTYPEKEKEHNIAGTVYITFVVEKNGSVTGAKVLRGVANGPGLDSTALAVVKAMPKWQPGQQNGHPVRVQFNLPINFQLK